MMIGGSICEPSVHDDGTHGGNEEGDPAHHDEHGGGQVHRQQEGAQRPRELDLEPVHAVVTWWFVLVLVFKYKC